MKTRGRCWTPRSHCINSDSFVQCRRQCHRWCFWQCSRKEEIAIPAHLATATPLQQDILRVLAYFDIFGHPLSPEEIYRFLPSDSTTPQNVEEACAADPLGSFVRLNQGYFSLATSDEQIATRRQSKEKIASKQWDLALRISTILKHFPFVRAIFVSGELSKGVATVTSDIDFLIVTASNRLWLCRSFFPIFKRLLPRRLKRLLCFNTFITEDHLVFPNQNLYSAIELVTLQPVYVTNNLHRRLLDENHWVSEFLPNHPHAHGEVPTHYQERVSRLPLLIERILDRLDTLLLILWRTLIHWKFSAIPAPKREELFMCTKNYATGYSEDHGTRILNEYRRRLEKLPLIGMDD